MNQVNTFMISKFVGATTLTSLFIMSILLLTLSFTQASFETPTAIIAIFLLTIIFSLVAMLVGFTLKKLNFRLNSIFKYLMLFLLGTTSTFVTIGLIELAFVAWTLNVLIGLMAVSIISGIIFTIAGKFSIPK